MNVNLGRMNVVIVALLQPLPPPTHPFLFCVLLRMEKTIFLVLMVLTSIQNQITS